MINSPDINDMFIAGMELRDAVMLEKKIEQQPEIPASYWWGLLNREVPETRQ